MVGNEIASSVSHYRFPATAALQCAADQIESGAGQGDGRVLAAGRVQLGRTFSGIGQDRRSAILRMIHADCSGVHQFLSNRLWYTPLNVAA